MKKRNPGRLLAASLLAVLGMGFLAGSASADRKYFLQSYTPYLAQAGTLELETWLTARSGKQDPREHTAWAQRLEFEYAVADRLTAAAYLNFSQPSGEAMHFDSPSLELIYRLTEAGSFPLDSALYLETSESGEELEIEPKILLARRFGRFVSTTNLIGELEYRHNDEELLPDGRILRKAFTGEISAGVAYELATPVAIALEAKCRADYPNFGRRSAAVWSLGPSLNLQSGKVQLAVGVLSQISGTPKTRGNRNLVDFEKTQVRAILGIDL